MRKNLRALNPTIVENGKATLRRSIVRKDGGGGGARNRWAGSSRHGEGGGNDHAKTAVQLGGEAEKKERKTSQEDVSPPLQLRSIFSRFLHTKEAALAGSRQERRGAVEKEDTLDEPGGLGIKLSWLLPVLFSGSSQVERDGEESMHFQKLTHVASGQRGRREL